MEPVVSVVLVWIAFSYSICQMLPEINTAGLLRTIGNAIVGVGALIALMSGSADIMIYGVGLKAFEKLLFNCGISL